MLEINSEQIAKATSVGFFPILLIMTLIKIVEASESSSTIEIINDFNNSRKPYNFDKDGFSNEYEISLGYDYFDSYSHPQISDEFFSTFNNFSGYSKFAQNKDISGLISFLHSQESYKTETISEFYIDEDGDGLVKGLETLYTFEHYYRTEPSKRNDNNSESSLSKTITNETLGLLPKGVFNINLIRGAKIKFQDEKGERYEKFKLMRL